MTREIQARSDCTLGNRTYTVLEHRTGQRTTTEPPDYEPKTTEIDETRTVTVNEAAQVVAGGWIPISLQRYHDEAVDTLLYEHDAGYFCRGTPDVIAKLVKGVGIVSYYDACTGERYVLKEVQFE